MINLNDDNKIRRSNDTNQQRHCIDGKHSYNIVTLPEELQAPHITHCCPGISPPGEEQKVEKDGMGIHIHKKLQF